MTRFILECTKTGRWWRYAIEAMAYRAAYHLGVTDFTIERQG